MKILSDEQYDIQMNELGLVMDQEYGRYFLGDMAFLTNVDDCINELADLIACNSQGHPTYLSQVLMDFSKRGADLVIGPGTIEEDGTRAKKALYCTNYKELYTSEVEKSNEKNSKIR